MFDRILERAKGMAVAVVIAALLAIAGTILLAVAFAITLERWLIVPAAFGVAGGSVLILSGLALWIGFHKASPSNHDTNAVAAEPHSAADDVLAALNMPLDVTKKLIFERPIAALIIAVGAGLVLARRPHLAVNIAERLIAQQTR